AGLVPVHRCLTTDDILGQFGQQKAAAQGKYREFVESGTQKASIWDELRAQSFLGVEGFAEALLDHVRGKSELREVPKGQRYLGRPSLEKLFAGSRGRKTARDRAIAAAVNRYGYSQMEVADYLHLHYSTISRLMKMVSNHQK
ncbi:MAG: addiction module toxin RelE, partial [Gammaproteobacteria bacterium]